MEILQTVEWRITFSLWTFVAGVAMVSLANADKMKQAAVAMGGILGPVVILSLMGAFMCGFGIYTSINSARRITTVSSRSVTATSVCRMKQ